ncbi:LamG-like jellyroll fold domain-containing protein [Flavobacterium sp. FlaQc-47]|uniref:LamG-like jellyroll fold domain-containing protein n=1 Tax=Flavobacterium sp. FlaQc-47 TaxID=3374180 RepID=UPI003756FB98
MKTKLLLLLLLATFSVSAQTPNVPTYVPTNGLLVYYPFDGNVADQSGNGVNGNPQNLTLTTDRSGNSNAAYSFNGINSAMSINLSNQPQVTNTRTIAGWFKATDPVSSSSFDFCLASYGAVADSFKISFYRKGYLDVNFDSQVFESQKNFFNDQWTFFAMVFDENTHVFSLYINNVLELTGTVNAFTNGFGGICEIGKNSSKDYFEGSIDDIGIWNRALTQKEITDLYESGKPANLYTLIPDANFEKKLIDLGIDSGAIDGKVPTSNIASLANLDVSSSSISDLSGIEDFKNLDALYFSSNLLTNVDLSKNNKLFLFFGRDNKLTSIKLPENNQLYHIYLDRNNLASLDVSKCDSLRNLSAEDNQLTNINLSKSKDLATLFLDRNKLTMLDISKNTVLETVWCGENQLSSVILPDSDNLDVLYLNDNKLTSLDISKYTTLKEFVCSTNQLTEINISNNKALTFFHCQQNKLTNIDVSNNKSLESLHCYENQLKTLNISENKALTALWCHTNQLTTLDVSQNTALIKLNTYNNKLVTVNVKNGNNANLNIYTNGFKNNPDLTCIQVDDVEFANTNWGSKKDAAATFNTNCSIDFVLLPDTSFEQKLIDLGIDTDGLNGRITTANISTITSLDLSNSNIQDLTGIEYFTALTFLDCSDNQLKTLDVSKNLALETLNASSNQITTLDFSKNTKLKIVYITNNPLISVNLQNGNNRNFVLSSSTDKKTAALYTSFLGLTTLSCIKVDDPVYSNANWSKIKEPTTIYSATCSALGIEDAAFNKAVLYPNPTKGEVNINNIALEKATVYNSSGQLVKTFTLNSANTNNTINLSGLPKGVYYVYLINQNAASAKKVIVE